ncbi:membrane protein [Agromyces luteolus]|uniref:EamA family transporter n=1 Tax=Agromyces luteolus TaxID=88373 RepID=A0A7C9LK05_9MICO|nr:EamA family transporter [Agromyces luteolus]MUN08974.1 EamA family transporter [Agromyces luteolus]GLK28662.1 membrane protein [Agromyces luteolus]
MTRRGFFLFAALGVAWGIPYLFIKVAVSELEPAMVVLGRSALAALLLMPLAFYRREVWQVVRRWKPMLAYTVVEIVLPWYFLSAAEQRLPSSTAGLLLATVPLAGVAIAFIMGRPERLTRLNWLGIALGMLGVAALVGLDIAGSDLIAVAQMAVVVIGYALGPAILARWMPDLPGVGVVAVSLAATAVVYVPFVLFTGAWPAAWPSTNVIVSIIVLAVICSALAFLLMVALIGEIGPVKATAITYVNPAVAILAGALVLGERVTVWTIVGFVLVLAGSYLVTRKRREQIAAEGVEEACAEQASLTLAEGGPEPEPEPEAPIGRP